MLRFLCSSCLGCAAKEKFESGPDEDEDEDGEAKAGSRANLVQMQKTIDVKPRVGILKPPKKTFDADKESEENEEDEDDANDDSGACLDELLKNNKEEESPKPHLLNEHDQVQLTVSSINTVLEDLVETDDEGLESSDKVKTAVLVDVSKPRPTSRPQFQRQISEGGGGGVKKRGRLRRDPSPTVSFKAEPSVIPHADSVSKRQRSRSDAGKFKFRSPSSSISSVGKMAWLKSNRKSTEFLPLKTKRQSMITSIDPIAAVLDGFEQALGGRDFDMEEVEHLAVTAALEAELKRVQSKPRTRSDKFDYFRSSRTRALSGGNKASFDWPLGKLGRLRRQKSNIKSKDVAAAEQEMRSASAVALTSVGNEYNLLKRRHSERRSKRAGNSESGKVRTVAFEEPTLWNLWSASLKFFWGESSSKRRRHLTDPSNISFPSKMGLFFFWK